MNEQDQSADSATLKKWIAAGLSLGIAANVMAWYLWPRMSPLSDPLDRLMLGIQCCAGIGVVGFLMLQGLWRLMDSPAAEDPFADAESRRWKVNQRVLDNTIEQALIFAPIYLALAVRMDAEHVHMLPALMTLWCVGRLLFWAGYRHALHARAIGMDITTVTTLVTLLWLVATLV